MTWVVFLLLEGRHDAVLKRRSQKSTKTPREWQSGRETQPANTLFSLAQHVIRRAQVKTARCFCQGSSQLACEEPDTCPRCWHVHPSPRIPQQGARWEREGGSWTFLLQTHIQCQPARSPTYRQNTPPSTSCPCRYTSFPRAQLARYSQDRPVLKLKVQLKVRDLPQPQANRDPGRAVRRGQVSVGENRVCGNQAWGSISLCSLSIAAVTNDCEGSSQYNE